MGTNSFNFCDIDSPCESRTHCTPVWCRKVITNGNFLILIQAIVTYLIIIITYSIVSAARSTRDTISNVISRAWWHKYFAIFLHKFVACSATFNLTVHATFCLAIYQKIAKILFFMKKRSPVVKASNYKDITTSRFMAFGYILC